MEKTSKNVNRKAVLKWIFIVGVNAVVALTVILFSVYYSLKQTNTRYKDKEVGFSTALDAMGQTAYMNLHNEQVYCDNWATYINSRYENDRINTFKLSDVADFVGKINTDDERIKVQVVDYTTYNAFYVTKAGMEVEIHPTLDYNPVKEQVQKALVESRDCQKDTSHLHITRPFANPAVTDKTSETLGFCHYIWAIDDVFKDGTGAAEKFALVRLLEVEDFYGKWMPTSFEKARLSVVDKEGAFIVPFNLLNTQTNKGEKVESVKEASFFDYLKERTNAGESVVNSMISAFGKELAKSGEFEGEIKCANKGKDGYYSYHRLNEEEEWVLVGYIARSDLNITTLDTTLAAIVITGFLILIVFDGVYIIITNKRLKKSMEEITYANQAKTRFLSSMSHDIRTPMNAIIGMTTIAAKRIDDKKQVSECLLQITRASNHLLTLINDVLDISKVESGKLSLNPSVFSLADLMKNIISISQPNIKEKEMEFEIHARKIRHEYIYADELRLNQILINLISNAIKYTPEKGSVLIGVEEQPSEKGANVARLIFTVTDTGIGISDEFMKTMYDTFTRDIDSRINTIQGAGLGLAITKQMVELMDGTIEVQSKLGEGTKFTVTLDLPIAEKLTDDYLLPPLKILVADDDELFLESAEDTLKSLGLDTDLATSGEEAVQKVSERHDSGNDYNCVIVDWKMPNMDGLETIREIRKKVGPDVSVIIISAYDWTEIEEQAIKAGANGFITKPLFRSCVYNKLNELFNLDHSEKPVKKEEENEFKGMHLLIAEDNDINWEIIQVMLEFQGITSERAVNGQVCVDMINAAEEGYYKAILMDVQMPIMNGNDATRAIRKSDKEYVKNIPIIAMTADAFAEDIVACKEAGMNGHVAKPIDMQKLLKELRSALEL